MIGGEMKPHASVSALAVKLGMSRQNFYKGRGGGRKRAPALRGS
jgi:hypothetical protein